VSQTIINFLHIVITDMPVLRGKVLDRETRAPLAWVLITLNTYSTTSGIDGNYELRVPAGDYTLKARSMEYRPYTRRVSLPEEKVYVINILLERAVLRE